MSVWKAGRFAPPLRPAFAIRRAGCMGILSHRFYPGADRGVAHDQLGIERSAIETPEVAFRGDPCSVAAHRRWVSVPPRRKLLQRQRPANRRRREGGQSKPGTREIGP